MTLEKIRRKVRELHAKTRRELLLKRIGIPLMVAAIAGFGIAKGHDTVLRMVFALAIAWSLAGQYFLSRGMRSATLPGDAALSTGLEFYRREVERRRHLFGRVMGWSFGPVVLVIAALIALIVSFGIGNRRMPLKGTLFKMIPFLAMVVIWVVGVFVIRIRDQRELQREIDELNDTEEENRR